MKKKSVRLSGKKPISQKRRIEEIVDAALTSQGNKDEWFEWFEAYINWPGPYPCRESDELAGQLDELQKKVEKYLNGAGKEMLSQLITCQDEYCGAIGREYFEGGLAVGRASEAERRMS